MIDHDRLIRGAPGTESFQIGICEGCGKEYPPGNWRDRHMIEEGHECGRIVTWTARRESASHDPHVVHSAEIGAFGNWFGVVNGDTVTVVNGILHLNNRSVKEMAQARKETFAYFNETTQVACKCGHLGQAHAIDGDADTMHRACCSYPTCSCERFTES